MKAVGVYGLLFFQLFCMFKNFLKLRRICLPSRRPTFEPWVGKIPWRRKQHPTPVLFLGNPVDRGTWRAMVHGVHKSQIQISS